MPDTTIFDVAVIGAGPAGASAAYTAAKEGLSTLLLEEHAVVGEPVHCGECLSNFAAKRMGLELPPEAISAPVKGIRIVWPDGTSTLWREEGYALDKHVFEQWLATRAQQAGAILQLSSRVGAMSRANGVWTLATPKGPARARALIDASGVDSVSNKLTGLNPRGFSAINGAQYLMQDVPNDGYIEFFLWPRLAPEGYLWIIPKRNGAANVGLVTPQAARVHPNLKQFILEWHLEGKKILKAFGGRIPSSGPLARTYSDGLLLAGDAAGFTSPMFEGGTQLSLKSGQLAAKTIARASRSRKPEAIDINQLNSGAGRPSAPSPANPLSPAPAPSLDGPCPASSFDDPYRAYALSEYDNAWRTEFPPYQKLLDGRHHMYGLNDAELNALSRILPRALNDMTPLTKAAIGVNLVFHPHLLKKNVLSALNTFSYSTGAQYGW